MFNKIAVKLIDHTMNHAQIRWLVSLFKLEYQLQYLQSIEVPEDLFRFALKVTYLAEFLFQTYNLVANTV